MSARCGECEFAVDHETGDLVLSVGKCISPQSAMRLASNILQGGMAVLEDFLERSNGDDIKIQSPVASLLSFAMDAASALSLAAERGLDADEDTATAEDEA